VKFVIKKAKVIKKTFRRKSIKKNISFPPEARSSRRALRVVSFSYGSISHLSSINPTLTSH